MRYSTQLDRFGLVFVLLTFAVLTAGLSRTRLPICDEGFYADPAFNLVAHGNMGSPALVANTRLHGIERYTYWEMPLHILATAGAFRAFGVSLMVMRGLALFWGVLALCAWYVFLRELFPGRAVALLAVGLLSIDFTFLTAATTGRSDMLSFALGSAALAAYVRLRTAHLSLALFCGHALVMLSGLAHPNGGMASFSSLAAVSLWLDRSRFRWADLAFSLAPYAAGAACWAGYILQRPDYFAAQFGSSASGRLSGLLRPWTAVRGELLRYADTYGLQSSGLSRLRAVPLMIYAAGLTTVLCVRRLRNDSSCRLLLLIAGIQIVLLTFMEATKQPWYLLFLVGVPVSLTSAAGVLLMEKSKQATVVILAGLLLIVAQVAHTIVLMKRDALGQLYAPAVNLIRENLGPMGVVAASSEFGFGIGFDRILDDPMLGSSLGVKPVIVVLDANYRANHDSFRVHNPELLRSLEQDLAAHYKILSANSTYTVFALSGEHPGNDPPQF